MMSRKIPVSTRVFIIGPIVFSSLNAATMAAIDLPFIRSRHNLIPSRTRFPFSQRPYSMNKVS